MTDTVVPSGPPPRAGRREWIGLAVLALPAMLIAMDMTLLHLAVPQLTADLRPSSSQLLWILDIYGFLIAGFLITMGTVGDRIGRRRLLLLGAIAFGVASVLAAYSTSSEALIATRALLGIAGATLMPSTLALIRNMFHDPGQRTAAIGAWMTSFMVGMTVGPLIGGAMLERFWWGSVFLLAVPAMVLLLVTGPKLLPEYRDPAPGRLDLVSVVLSLAAILPIIYGIKEIARDGLAGLPVTALVVGLVMGVAFVRRQRGLRDPLLDLRLFANRKFSASLGTLTLTLFAMSGVFLFLAQYLQLVVGLSPFEAGLWALPQAGAMVVVAFLTPVLVKRIRPAYLMSAGLVLAAAGFAMLTRLDGDGRLGLLVAAMIVFSIGSGPMTILGIDMIVGAVPPERAGAASAISETNQEFGMAIGIAILGSVGTALYRGALADTMPAGIPAAGVEAARETLPGAVLVAESLPGGADGQLGAQLVEAARDAFARGIQVNAVIAAVAMVAGAILAGVLLRHIRPTAEAESSQETSATDEDLAKI